MHSETKLCTSLLWNFEWDIITHLQAMYPWINSSNCWNYRFFGNLILLTCINCVHFGILDPHSMDNCDFCSLIVIWWVHTYRCSFGIYIIIRWLHFFFNAMIALDTATIYWKHALSITLFISCSNMVLELLGLWYRFCKNMREFQ